MGQLGRTVASKQEGPGFNPWADQECLSGGVCTFSIIKGGFHLVSFHGPKTLVSVGECVCERLFVTVFCPAMDVTFVPCDGRHLCAQSRLGSGPGSLRSEHT